MKSLMRYVCVCVSMCGEERGGLWGLHLIAEGDWQCGIGQYLSTTELRKIGLSLMTFSSIETCTAPFLLKMTNLRTCGSGFVLRRSSCHVHTTRWTQDEFSVLSQHEFFNLAPNWTEKKWGKTREIRNKISSVVTCLLFFSPTANETWQKSKKGIIK